MRNAYPSDDMKKSTHIRDPMKELVRRYRKKFRVPENLDHYSKRDYEIAEQKYVKLCITRGKC